MFGFNTTPPPRHLRSINPVAGEWRALKIGNTLTLTDEDSVKLVTDGKGPFPIIGTIKSVTTITEASRLAEWRIFSFDSTLPIVIAKFVGDSVKVMLLRDSQFWKQAKRSELVNHSDQANDILFLFTAPQDVDAFCRGSAPQRIQWVQQLSFAGFFDRNALASDGQEWKYVQRNDREFHCDIAQALTFGCAVASAGQMATISEYGADTAGVADPELVILETGSKTNGTIRILTGAEISCDTIMVS